MDKKVSLKKAVSDSPNVFVCPICKTERDNVLILPCHPQHKACKDCLRKQILEIGGTLKCHECTSLFGWIDLELLKVDGAEDVPEKQACTMCPDESRQPAHVYCVVCFDKLCVTCEETHKAAYRKKDHRVISFDNLRSAVEKHTNSRCQKDRHQSSPAVVICRKCYEIGCDFCRVPPSACSEAANAGDVHDYAPLNADPVKTKLNGLKTELKSKVEKLNFDVKSLHLSMERYRIDVEEYKSTNQQRVQGKIKQLGGESKRMQENMEQLLYTKKDEFTVQKDKCESSILKLSDLLDGVNAILNCSNDVKLIQTEKRTVEQIQQKLDEIIVPMDWCLPKLIFHGSTDTNLLGLELLNVLKPTGVKPIEPMAEDAGTGNACYTVYVSDDGSCVHGGEGYCSLGFTIPTPSTRILCIRKVSEHYWMALMEDPTLSTAFIATFVRELEGEDEEEKEVFKEVTTKKMSVKYTGGMNTQFQLVGDMIYHTTSSVASGQIERFNKDNSVSCGVISHPMMAQTWKICSSLDDQLFVSSNGQHIYSFPYSEKEGPIKCATVIDVGGSPSAIAYYKECIYALRSKQLSVYHRGELVAGPWTLSKLSGNNYDMSINEMGLLVVADNTAGVQRYQLEF